MNFDEGAAGVLVSKVLLGVSIGVVLSAMALLTVGAVVAWRNRDVIGDYIRVMPSTNIRIAITLILFLATGVRYLSIGTPEGDGWDSWLMVLVGMAGVDMIQFGAKRFSDATYTAAKQGPSPVTVESPSTVQVTNTPPTPAVEAAQPARDDKATVTIVPAPSALPSDGAVG